MTFRPNAPLSNKPRNVPADETYREAEYLKSLSERRQPITVKLLDGETVEGWIEYFDQNMIRVTREGAPNLFIFKHDIAYIAEGDGRKQHMRDRSEG